MATQTVFEQQLSRQEQLDLKNKRAGLLIFQLSWILTFICLIVVNLWFRGQAAQWPPEGVQRELIIPTLSVLALVVSSYFGRKGVRAMKNNDLAGLLQNWRWTLLLGLFFAVAMGYEFLVVPGVVATADTSMYLNIYRLMVGFHHVHAMASLFYLWRVYQYGQRSGYGPSNFWPVEGGAGLWDFVTVAWVLFYGVLYII